ncbi:hypothetical protein [Paraburkholderia sp. BL17N1]|uniref:hypothetical protein n=1 Tax=Paraburkholderia sp. BL17N1 TaxID=1938798 RepID=UPI000F0FF3BE|nr:hypothetical protein [Paraburkholderia sp. BL17N1]RKR38352.1 hypothetical protein B0G82_6485 [Paraburkholderia sp. BL17N1]
MKNEMWVFNDPPNVAVIANRSVVFEQDWIAYVSHDNEDGGWQFHGSRSGQMQEGDAVAASLLNIVELDVTVQALSDLPRGWHV